MGDHSNIMCDLCGEEFPGIRQLKVYTKLLKTLIDFQLPYILYV